MPRLRQTLIAVPPHDPAQVKRIRDRLRRAEGQVRGLQRMLDENRLCEEVVTQLVAARGPLPASIRHTDFTCPRAARLAHQMAQLNPPITADVIEANEFPELSQRLNVMCVPKTIINGSQDLLGAQPEARLMQAIRAALGATREE